MACYQKFAVHLLYCLSKFLKVLSLKKESSNKLLVEFQKEGPGEDKYPSQEKGMSD